MSLLLRHICQRSRAFHAILRQHRCCSSAAADVSAGPDTRRGTDEQQPHAAAVGMPDTQQPVLHPTLADNHPAGAAKQPETDLIRHLKGIINVRDILSTVCHTCSPQLGVGPITVADYMSVRGNVLIHHMYMHVCLDTTGGPRQPHVGLLHQRQPGRVWIQGRFRHLT